MPRDTLRARLNPAAVKSRALRLPISQALRSVISTYGEKKKKKTTRAGGRSHPGNLGHSALSRLRRRPMHLVAHLRRAYLRDPRGTRNCAHNLRARHIWGYIRLPGERAKNNTLASEHAGKKSGVYTQRVRRARRGEAKRRVNRGEEKVVTKSHTRESPVQRRGATNR